MNWSGSERRDIELLRWLLAEPGRAALGQPGPGPAGGGIPRRARRIWRRRLDRADAATLRWLGVEVSVRRARRSSQPRTQPATVDRAALHRAVRRELRRFAEASG